jgi:aspartyl-tRNA(Asn)/glutamyl-tRNA(Gln) amidotransferase subunit B
MEIVTEPVVRTGEQARRYAEELQLLLRAIGVSDADMERGQMRVEANVSLRPRGTEAFGTRVEVKNMNSFRAVERAIAFEIERQAASLETGEALVQETRGWDDGRQATYRMRLKETSEDYRYFPEPDLPPLTVDAEWLEALGARLPELPAARRARYASLGLTAYDAALIAADDRATAMLESLLATDVPPKEAANWVAGEYLRLLRKHGEGDVHTTSVDAVAAQLGELIRQVLADRITRTNAKEAFEESFLSRRPVAEIIAERGFQKISDTVALDRLVDEVLAANPAAIADVAAGKPQAIGFLVGQVMKASKGQANAALVQAAIRARTGGG